MGVTPSKIPNAIIETSDFYLCNDGTYPDPRDHYTIRCTLFTSLVLQHQPLHWSTRGNFRRYQFWRDFVQPRVDKLAKKQLLEIDPEKRPEWFLANRYQLQRDFVAPEGWKFHDGEVEGWYREWKELCRSLAKTSVHII